MNDFLQSLWHDLREKRLWPVALGLLIALVAVPVVLLKPASEPAPSAPSPPTVGTRPQAPTLKTSDGGLMHSSDLGVFDPKNPFKPAVRFARLRSASASSGPASSTPAGATSASTASTSSAGGSVSSGSGSASAPAPGSGVVRRGRTVFYTYVIDVEFGRRGHERLRKGVKRLAMLPSDRNPLLVFLGVAGDRRRAVFLVDSSLRQRGEGTCRPDDETCTFLYLSADPKRNGHIFTDPNGQQWVIRLKDIRRIIVRSAKSAKSSRHDARSRAGSRARPFGFPLFDEIRR